MEGINYTAFVARSGNRIATAEIVEEFDRAAALRITWQFQADSADIREFEAWVQRQMPEPLDISNTGPKSGWKQDPKTWEKERQHIAEWKRKNGLVSDAGE